MHNQITCKTHER